MKRLFSILKNRRTQYVLIIWILLLKTVEITTNLLSQVELTRFFSVLGFSDLSETSSAIWNTLLIVAVFWLIYRLSRDALQIPFPRKPLSKKEILSLTILLTWVISAVVTSLQFASLVTTPSANPKLEVSRYYSPLSMETGVSPAKVKLDGEDGSKVALDLSRSIFSDPLSIYNGGEPSSYGTTIGASYFTLRNSSLEQRMIEMRFAGNGSDDAQGWFAYKILFQTPLPIGESNMLMLILKLSESNDSSAWTYIKIDFLSEENKTFSLFWKFQEVFANYEYLSDNGTRNNYLLGSVTDWRFYSFDINALFYMSFSHKPSYIIGTEYGIGAKADNDVTAQILLAKISKEPFEINGRKVNDLKPVIQLTTEGSFSFTGLDMHRLVVILMPDPTEKNISIGWSILGAFRTESYRWDTSSFSNMTEIKMSFNVSSNCKKLLLNGMEITSESKSQQLAVYDLVPNKAQVNLVVAEETDAYLLPLSILLPIVVALSYVLLKVARYSSKKSIAKSLSSHSSQQKA